MEWLPTPVFWPGEFHGWSSLAGCSPWGRKEYDKTERLSVSVSIAFWIVLEIEILRHKCLDFLNLDHNNLSPSVSVIVYNSEGFIYDVTSIPRKTIHCLQTFGIWGFHLCTLTLLLLVGIQPSALTSGK